VLEAEHLARPGERFGPIAGAVVGHDALDPHAQTRILGDSRLGKRDCAFFFLVLHDLAEGDARCIVDADVDELPADAKVAVDYACLSSSDPMAHGADSSKLLDIDMDELAGLLALVAPNWFGRLQRRETVDAKAAQNAADSGPRHTESAAICLAV
jgi:hypothetical protein